MMYELQNKATGRKIVVNQDQIDKLKAKDWLKRYHAPKPVAGTDSDAFVPEEIKRTKPKTTESKATPVASAIPDKLPVNTKG